MSGTTCRTVDVRPVRLRPLELVRLGLLGIRTRPMRAVLSALGIALGIATLVVVTGIPAASQRALDAELERLGPNLLEVNATAASAQDASFPPEAVSMAARIKPVEVAAGVANTHSTISRNDRNGDADYSGVAVLASTDNLLDAVNVGLSSGRFLDPAMDKQPTVVLGSVAAARLGITRIDRGAPSPLVYIGRNWFAVIGVLNQTPMTPELDRAAFVGWDVARAKLAFNGRSTVVYVRAQESEIDAVRDVLPATLNPQLPGRAQVSRPSDALAAKRATHQVFSSLLLGLAAIALLVGGVGVANTMIVSVLERRRDIGLRRALGANRRQIRGQFLIESVALSGLGGVAGTLLGAAATVGYALYQGWPIVVPLPTMAAGLGGALLVGALAGVYPAVRAARLTPTQALATT
jgi:putative ABC transport system permease protein